ncbi:MAG: LytTR family DNA-binding domain-containing protein [Paludibacter sp.]|nr:LytTR family DNA-binding domain-containing protein [Paludibacter sp.]
MKFEALKSSFSADARILEMLKQSLASQPQYRKTLLVQYRESFIPLQISEIAVFFVDNEILYVYTFDQQKYAVYRPLGEIEAELNSSEFFRISRQALINRKAVKEVQPYFNRKVSIHTPIKLPETLVVSRLKVSEFMKWLEE